MAQSASVEEIKPVTPVKSGRRVLVAASSTGGHLFPAVHIAEAILMQAPGSQVQFIGAGKPLEETVLVQRGYTRHIVAAAGVKHRGISGFLSFLCKLPTAVLQLRKLYRAFKPDVVVGVGGYVSVLPLLTARVMGIPTWAHEAEPHLGLANNVLSFFCKNFSVAHEGTKLRQGVKGLVSGQPVRSDLKKIDRDTLVDGAPKRLLVLGGSQGARGLDNAVAAIGPVLAKQGIEVVHQSRPESVPMVGAAYKEAGVSAHVVGFIEDMVGAYEWADVIISRAGASSVAEIACVNRPTIFVPYPHQQGTHQTDNARSLVVKEKALLVEETAPDFSQRLREALVEILNPSNFLRMKRAPCEAKGLDAAGRIAEGILQVSAATR